MNIECFCRIFYYYYWFRYPKLYTSLCFRLSWTSRISDWERFSYCMNHLFHNSGLSCILSLWSTLPVLVNKLYQAIIISCHVTFIIFLTKLHWTCTTEWISWNNRQFFIFSILLYTLQKYRKNNEQSQTTSVRCGFGISTAIYLQTQDIMVLIYQWTGIL